MKHKYFIYRSMLQGGPGREGHVIAEFLDYLIRTVGANLDANRKKQEDRLQGLFGSAPSHPQLFV